MNSYQVFVPLRLQLLTQLLGHKSCRFVLVFSPLPIQKLVELLESLLACHIILGHDLTNRFEQPTIQLPDFHVIIELNQTYIGNSLKSQRTETRVRCQQCVRSSNVKRYILPYLHVDLLYVQMLQGMIYQIKVGFYVCSTVEQ